MTAAARPRPRDPHAAETREGFAPAAFVIGDEAPAVRTGALESGARADQVAVVTALDPVAARLAEFRGAVFVKGSRRWQLERALEPAAAAATH